MKEELLNPSVNGENESGIYSIYPGIDLRYTELKSNNLSARRGAAAEILQINYCKSGQIAWKMKDGNQYLPQSRRLFPAQNEHPQGFCGHFSDRTVHGTYNLH